MYWQYTTALAFSVLAVTNPVISSAANAIESLIFGVLQVFSLRPHFGCMPRLDVRLRVLLIWINVLGPDQASASGQTEKSRQRDGTAGLSSATDMYCDCRDGC